MKKAFKPALFVLLMCGVFGVDEDEVKSVSVMEGDSVTLPTDLTQIKTFYLIEWWFKDQLIASFDGSKTKYPYERFRGRLKLDLTGSLTITNMKTNHSGLYKLQIELNSGTVHVDFTVTVYESPSVIDAGKAEMKSVSVKSGDRVTLQTGVTQISGDELIVWRFGEEGKLIAKADIEAKSSPLYYDERFRNCLENQTGSLIITNTRSTDSGFYSVKISSNNKQTLYKRFSVTVIVTVTVSEPGLSPGGKAGIVVAVLLVLAAAAVVVFYYRRKISELRKQILIVEEGEDITLKPNNTIQKGDVILWMFGEGEQQTSIAKLIGETGEIVTHDYAADGRFKDRLYLDETTGSLIISNSITTHSGLYTLYITSSSGDSQQRFIITIKERVEGKSVEDGDTVTLKPDTEIQRDDRIQWTFEDQDDVIAQIRGGTGEICIYDDAAEGRFRGRLKLEKTGSLIITNITAADTGPYTLQIISSNRGTLCKRFWVFIPLRRVFVAEGESVHLFTDHPEIERGDEIQWMFGDENSLIAEIKGGTGETHDGADGRFRDRLQLDKRTGDLTIKNSTAKDKGDYNLKIRNRKGNKNWTYRVTIRGRRVSVIEGESVRLPTDHPKIERDDVIQWRFRDEIIAEIKEGTGKTHDGPDERFRDRLQLDKRTGHLTIKSFTDEDAGYYKLKIRNRKGNKNWTYSVTIKVRFVSVIEGESVRLPTDHPKIERDDEIQWRFRDEIIAEIKEGTGKTHDGPAERFRDRLQLNDRTGDLTIKNFTDEDTGYYKLKIRSSKGNKNWTYRVTIRGRDVSVTEGESVCLSTDRPKIERDDVIQWMCGDEIIAEIKEGTGKTHDGADGRFRDRLQLNDQTGDLTIKNCTAKDTGDYNLKIRSSKGNKNWTYRVTIRVTDVFVTAGESVCLSTDHPEIERDDEIQWMFEDEIIAEIKEGTGETHDGAAERFRDRLQLNDQTGDLTIKNSTYKHTGYYKLKIRSSKGNKNWTYSVGVRVAIKPRKELPVKGNNDESVVEMQPLLDK